MRKVVTTTELNEVLANTSNSIGTFVQLLQVTEPKLTKKDRVTKEPAKYSKIHKISSLNVLFNTDYQNGVKNQLDRENKAESEYKQGTNTMPLELCENNNFFGLYKGQAVVQYRPYNNSKPHTKYFANGKIVDKENIGDILPKVYKATNQGTDKEIFWRKLYTKNIRKIKINGVLYVVKN